jgi:hypothetical protein
MKFDDLFDRIRVLLIDDNPTFLELEKRVDGERVPVPVIHDQGTGELERPELSELFELRWLASAGEAREFRDVSLAVAAVSPKALGKYGWVPEIVCFDYALTLDTRRVEEREFPPPFGW